MFNFPIKFKHITALILIILGKGNTVCALLVNTSMCLNLIGKHNVHHLRICAQVLPIFNGKLSHMEWK